MNKGYAGTGGLLWGETKACQAHLQCQSRNDNIKRTRARVCLPAVLLEALHGRACLTLRLVFQLRAQQGQQKSKKCDGRAGRGWGRVRRRAERCSRPLIHLSGTTSSSAVPPLARQRFTRAWQTRLRSSVPAPDRWQNQKVTSLWTGSVCCPADFPCAATARRRGWRRGGEQLWQLLNFVFVNFCTRDFANNTAAACDFCHGCCCCCHCWRRLVSRSQAFIYGTESQSVFLGPVGSGLLWITVAGPATLLTPVASGCARPWRVLLMACMPRTAQPQRDSRCSVPLPHIPAIILPIVLTFESWPLLLKCNTTPKQNQQSFFVRQQSYSLTRAPAEVRPQSASAGVNSSPPSDQQGSDSLWRGCLGSMCSSESPYQPSRPGLSRAFRPHAAYKAGPAPEQLETLEMSHISKKSWRRGEHKSWEAGKKMKVHIFMLDGLSS